MKKYNYSGWELPHFDKARNFKNYQFDLIKSHILNNIAEIGPGTGSLLEKYIFLNQKNSSL